MFGGCLAPPYILTAKMCMDPEDPARGDVIATNFFVSGLATLIQTFFGVRLPIVQSSANVFLVSGMAILSLPRWQCPEQGGKSLTSDLMNYNSSVPITEADPTEIWQVRMREVQGSLLLATLTEVILGMTGLCGVLLRWIGPLTIMVVVLLVGVFLFEELGELAGGQWGISFGTILLMILFSQYLHRIEVPCKSYDKVKGWKTTRFRLFQLFPVILTLCFMWSLCIILTASGVFAVGHPGRSDVGLKALYASKWFRVPYPMQFGVPTFSLGAVLGVVAAIIATVLESIGDYYACARIIDVPPPPNHAVNRGIMAEGLSSFISALFGSGTGTTSYSTNIGMLSITRVASRRVVLWTSVILILCGIFSKLGALFATIPAPIVGGLMCFLFPVIAGVAFSNLQFVDLNSGRNLFIAGFSFFAGLCLPKWVQRHPDAIDTGNIEVDQILSILLRSSMAVGGTIACFLDNTIHGTVEERGLGAWTKSKSTPEKGLSHGTVVDTSCYELPIGMTAIKRISWMRHIPFSPTYSKS